jgi:Leucine-rich repeat (LRR) protein
MLTSLTLLAVQEAGLRGSLPSEVALLSRLAELDLNQNSLTGTIPELLPLSNLDILSLRDNRFHGKTGL